MTQRFVAGEKYLTKRKKERSIMRLVPPPHSFAEETRRKVLTCKRRADFTPADISKV